MMGFWAKDFSTNSVGQMKWTKDVLPNTAGSKGHELVVELKATQAVKDSFLILQPFARINVHCVPNSLALVRCVPKYLHCRL